MNKHKLKLSLRKGLSRVLYYTGLHRLCNRLAPRRLTILAGHCVDAPEINGFLPPDMKIAGEKLASVLSWFQRHGYPIAGVEGGLKELDGGQKRGILALTMDDGYRDNLTHMVPILERFGAGATTYLESRPLTDRGVNWSHKFFWLIDRGDPEAFFRAYAERAEDGPSSLLLHQVLAEGEDLVYRGKRVLKYDTPAKERDALVQALFLEGGGDEQALCDTLYLSSEEAAALGKAGVELGGHTRSHHVLSGLSPEDQQQEIAGGREELRQVLGVESRAFAYPFGRNWDFNQDSAEAAERAGFSSAVTTHSGTNLASADRYRLKRIMIDMEADLPLIVAEACGGFELLRRLGVDLSE